MEALLETPIIDYKSKHLPINLNSHQHIPLGSLLQKAALVSAAQIEVALQDQKNYHNLKIGEILALRGWIKQETADFFARYWQYLVLHAKEGKSQYKIGQYLRAASLLENYQVREILTLQDVQKLRFGELAIAKGYIKPQTLEFFLENLCTEKDHQQSLAIYHKCAEKYLEINQPILAIKELKQAIKLDTENAVNHGLFCLAYLQINQVKIARLHLIKALHINGYESVVIEAKRAFEKVKFVIPSNS